MYDHMLWTVHFDVESAGKDATCRYVFCDLAVATDTAQIGIAVRK
jgi:hypothetical protein